MKTMPVAFFFYFKNRAATSIIYSQEFFISFAQTMFLTEQPRIKFQWDTLNSGLMGGDGIYVLKSNKDKLIVLLHI